MTDDVSRYLDSKTSKDLDTWLVQEEVESSAQDKQVKQAKSDNILGKWLDRHDGCRSVTLSFFCFSKKTKTFFTLGA